MEDIRMEGSDFASETAESDHAFRDQTVSMQLHSSEHELSDASEKDQPKQIMPQVTPRTDDVPAVERAQEVFATRHESPETERCRRFSSEGAGLGHLGGDMEGSAAQQAGRGRRASVGHTMDPGYISRPISLVEVVKGREMAPMPRVTSNPTLTAISNIAAARGMPPRSAAGAQLLKGSPKSRAGTSKTLAEKSVKKRSLSPAMVPPKKPTPKSLARPPRSTLRHYLVFEAFGKMNYMEATKHNIIKRTGVNARDLRILDFGMAAPASILHRERCLVFNMEHIKLLICSDQALLQIPDEFWSQDPLLAKFADDLQKRLNSTSLVSEVPKFSRQRTKMEANEISSDDGSQFNLPVLNKPVPVQTSEDRGYHSDGEWNNNENLSRLRFVQSSMKAKHFFEFKVLESALDNVCSLLDTETGDLEAGAYPAIDALSAKVTSAKLERVRQVKSRMTRLTARVTQVRDELEQLLDNDDDMNEMYISRKMVAESPHEAKTPGLQRTFTSTVNQGGEYSYEGISKLDIEELEDLLENYGERMSGTYTRLHALSEYIDDTEDFINILQDSQRNKLIQLDLVMTSLTFSITLLSMISSVFGMNVPSGLEDDSYAFSQILVGSGVVAAMVFVAFLAYSRKQNLL